MKSKIIIFITLLLSVMMICASCSSVTGVLNDSLNKLKKGDIESFCETLDNSSESVTDNIIAFYKHLNEDKTDIVKKVYSYMTYSISEKENKQDVLVLTISCINIKKLMNDVSDKVAVEGKDVVNVLNSMILDGSIEIKYMERYSFDVKLNKYNDSYRIPYSSNINSELYNALYILEFLRWISNI